MGVHPRCELLARKLATGKEKHDLFLLVDAGDQLEPVQDEKDFQRSVTNALVAIEEWMVAYDEECQSGSLVDQGWIEVVTIERLERLRNGRLQSAQVTNTLQAAGTVDHLSMQREHFGKRDASHYERRSYNFSFLVTT